MGTRLYVGNIPYGTTDLDLRTLFGQNGRRVSEVKIVTDRETGQSRGFAFVEMADPTEAQAVITELNGAAMGGRSIVVNEARERTPGGAGGGPGGPRPYGGGGGGPGGPPRSFSGPPGGGGPPRTGFGGPRPGGFGGGPGGPRSFGGPPGGGFDRGGPPGGPGAKDSTNKNEGRRRNRDRDKERERIRDEDDDY
jgi:cold-inducible RNA-binding protein